MQKVTGGNVQQKAAQAAYDAVEQLDQSAGKDLDLAKQGLGKVGTAWWMQGPPVCRWPGILPWVL